MKALLKSAGEIVGTFPEFLKKGKVKWIVALALVLYWLERENVSAAVLMYVGIGGIAAIAGHVVTDVVHTLAGKKEKKKGLK